MNKEISSISVDLKNDSNNIRLYVLSDVHLGSTQCNVDRFKEIVENISKDDNMYVILLGDILDTALKNSKTDIYSTSLSLAESQKLAVEILTPIKHKIIGMTPGNHENRVWKEVGVDLSLWLAEKLGLEDVYRNNGIALSISFGKDTNGHPYRLNVFGQHGAYGGGRKLGSAMNALEDLDGIVGNADIYIRAHTHSPVSGRRDIYDFNDKGNIVRRSKYYFNSPSVLEYGGYAYDKGYRPQNSEAKYLNIRAYNERKGSKLVKSFKIDEIML